MQKRATSLAIVIALMLLLALPTAASGETFTFKLAADKTSLNVGELVTITLTVTNNEGSEYGLFAMQNEIYFDNTVFEVVSGSVNTHGIGASTGIRSEGNESKIIFAVADMSMSPTGIRMDKETTVLTLNFRALAPAGAAQLRNENSKILLADDRAERDVVDGGSVTLPITDPTDPPTPDPTDPPTPDPTDPPTPDPTDPPTPDPTDPPTPDPTDPPTPGPTDPPTPGPTDPPTPGPTDPPTPGPAVPPIPGLPEYSFETGSRGEIIIDLPDSPLADFPDEHLCFAFTDIDGHWARAAICFCVEHRLFRGISETLFDPDGFMTRAMLVTVLHRMESEPTPRNVYGFADLEAGSWYEDAVNWAAENGIVEGYSPTVFAPYDNITREQLVTMIFRYQRFKGTAASVSDDLSGFRDGESVSPWALEAVRHGVGTGLIQGFEDDTVRPQDTATRAQVATILSRLLGLDV